MEAVCAKLCVDLSDRRAAHWIRQEDIFKKVRVSSSAHSTESFGFHHHFFRLLPVSIMRVVAVFSVMVHSIYWLLTCSDRTLLDEDADELAETRWRTDLHAASGAVRGGLEVMVGPGTCKLYYARGCEEAAWRVREVGGHGSRRNGASAAGGEGAGAGAGDGEEAEREMEAGETGRGGGEDAVMGSGSGSGRRRRGERRRRNRRRRTSLGEEEDREDREDDEGGGAGEWERLRERAEARLREQRRWVVQFEQGVLF